MDEANAALVAEGISERMVDRVFVASAQLNAVRTGGGWWREGRGMLTRCHTLLTALLPPRSSSFGSALTQRIRTRWWRL
jgi:hypothetical protein